MSKLHISQNGEAPVQYPEPEVESMFRQGRLEADAIYWKEGMSDWRPLRELFPPATTPPPPPAPAPAAPLSPYAPPSVNPVPAPPEPIPGRYTFTKDPRKLTRLLKMMLWIYGIILALNLLGHFAQLQLANSGSITAETAAANDSRQMMLGTLLTISSLSTIVVFGMWIYRANLNCRGFGAERMEFTPGWAVGWYFIPIASLFRPFQSMREIWQVSSNPRHWALEKVPSLLGWWWGLWIARIVLTQIAVVLSKQVNDVETLRSATVMLITATVENLFLVGVAVMLITRITAMQVRLVEESE